MRLEMYIEENDVVDNLTMASAVIEFCESDKVFKQEFKQEQGLDVVKVAKAILLEMVGDSNEQTTRNSG
jgi:hypothetical protein